MKTGVFAGSFCPVTVGHVDLIRRAAALTDKLYVAVGVNPEKNYAISTADRLQLLREATKDIINVEVTSYVGMTTDFCQKVGADVLFKAVRSAAELQTVLDVADANKLYWNGETVFLASSPQHRFVSSSLVRELVGLGKDVSMLVPEGLCDKIVKLLG